MKDVTIIGAGISGLSTGAYLTNFGQSVRILEKQSQVGGSMQTLKKNGYLIDFGPNTVVLNTPQVQEMINWSNMGKCQVPADVCATKRFVVRNGHLIPLPTNPIAFFKTPLFSWKSKLRLLREPFIGKGPEGETIAEFATRRLGKEFFQYAIDPFVSGVYAGNPHKLSVEYATSKIYRLEKRYGGLIKGLILGAKERKRQKRQTGETDKTKARICNFKDGISSFPINMAKRLGNAVHTGCQITHITKSDKGYLVEYSMEGNSLTVQSKALVLAVPAQSLHQLSLMIDDKYSGSLNSLPYAPLVQIFLGFEKSQIHHALDGFGVLIPQAEKSGILGALMNASMFPGRAPEGHTALTCFVGGAQHPELLSLSDEQLVSSCCDSLKRLFTIQGTPDFASIRRYPAAIPQYEKNYKTYLDQMLELETRNPNLYIGGNCKDGISVGDCLKSAQTIAEKIRCAS